MQTLEILSSCDVISDLKKNHNYWRRWLFRTIFFGLWVNWFPLKNRKKTILRWGLVLHKRHWNSYVFALELSDSDWITWLFTNLHTLLHLCVDWFLLVSEKVTPWSMILQFKWCCWGCFSLFFLIRSHLLLLRVSWQETKRPNIKTLTRTHTDSPWTFVLKPWSFIQTPSVCVYRWLGFSSFIVLSKKYPRPFFIQSYDRMD